MVINEDGFTYEDFSKRLTDKEKAIMLELFKGMNEDNLVYLYQKSKREDSLITRISGLLGITNKTVQNSISKILAKQDDMRYFLYATGSGVKGEYFISPELVLKNKHNYETIYRSIIPKLGNLADRV